jgi:transcriptional regulator with XRE-family HTH domain
VLGVEIRRLRYQLGLTQSAFADRLGKPSATVSAWELGKAMPAAANLAAVARVLGTDVGRLLADLALRPAPEVDGPPPTVTERPSLPGTIRCFALETVVVDVNGYPVGKPDFEIVRSTDNGDPRSYALHIRGNASYPRFWDGDAVEVVSDARIDDGDLTVVHHRDGRRWIRRVAFRQRRSVVRCHPLNPSEPVLELPVPEVRLHKVIGIKPRGTYRHEPDVGPFYGFRRRQ